MAKRHIAEIQTVLFDEMVKPLPFPLRREKHYIRSHSLLLTTN